MAIEITAANIRAMAPHAAQRIIQGIVDNQRAIVMGGIDTPLRLCHFMAQLAHESAHFQATREFASGSAYEGRSDLGNTRPGDGPRYRGRGLIQTIGRANYRQATITIRALDAAAPDFEAEPPALESFPWALLGAIAYWQSRNINAAADRDDAVRVTRLINGGSNGLEDRGRYLAKAKDIWITGAEATAATGSAPDGADDTPPVLRRGSQGHDVAILQNELIEAGIKVLADGDFGGHTEDAVRSFQTTRGLEVDGVVDKGTWDAIADKGKGVRPPPRRRASRRPPPGVSVAAYAPPQVRRDNQFLVQIYFFAEAFAGTVEKAAVQANAAATQVASDTTTLSEGEVYVVALEAAGGSVLTAPVTFTWDGRWKVARFGMSVPSAFQGDTLVCTAAVATGGRLLGSISFSLSVASGAAAVPDVHERAVIRRDKGFVSYSSKDRVEVLKRVSVIDAAGLNLFFDQVNLKAGEIFEERIHDEVDDCDVFLLFWSRHAADSPWVKAETERAVKRQPPGKNINPRIAPIPLEDEWIRPPPSLEGKIHFRSAFHDALMASLRESERRNEKE